MSIEHQFDIGLVAAMALKEKQIQQSRLEAEARKEATVKNAEAMAEAKVIDSKAELEKRKLMSESDEYRIRRVALADSERMKLEAEDLVVRRSSPTDRRQKSVWLTPKGKKTLARLRPLVLAHEARLTNGFPSRDKAALLELLGIVDGNLRKKTSAADIA